jgi:hypothetical protein
VNYGDHRNRQPVHQRRIAHLSVALVFQRLAELRGRREKTTIAIDRIEIDMDSPDRFAIATLKDRPSDEEVKAMRQKMRDAPPEDIDLHMGGEEEAKRGQEWLDGQGSKEKLP